MEPEASVEQSGAPAAAASIANVPDVALAGSSRDYATHLHDALALTHALPCT